MSYFLDTLMLRIGCFSHYLWGVAFLLFLLLLPHYGSQAATLLLFFIILIFIGVVYYILYSKDRLDSYIKMLEKNVRKSLKLDENTQTLTLTKKYDKCNTLLLKKTRRDYDVAFVFLSKEYLTIALKCPKFHMFWRERHGKEKKWAIKNNCASNKEYRYSYIQSSHFNSDKKTLDIVLTSGFVEHIACDKKDADSAIIKIRERLREAPRSLQTNIWSG